MVRSAFRPIVVLKPDGYYSRPSQPHCHIEAVGGSGTRIALHDMKQWSRKIQKSTSLSRRVWLVPVENLPEIDRAKWARFSLATESVTEWPCSVDPDSVVLYDSAVPQVELGAGVLELTVRL